MFQMVNKGIIDNNVIMVNILNDHGNSSVVKFGSWDADSIDTTSKPLWIFPTKSEKEWTLVSSKIFLDSN